MFARKPTTAVLVNVTPNYVHVARVTRPDERPVIVDSLAELAPDDELGLSSWLRREFREEARWIPGYCGFHPSSRVLVRENLIPRRIAEPGYLAAVVAAHAHVDVQRDWQLVALEADSGVAFAEEGQGRPGLVMGVSKAEIRTLQQALVRQNIRPRRLELGTLPALGGIVSWQARTSTDHAIAVCEIGTEDTRIFISGRNGVHIQPILPCGLRTIEEAAMKEFGCADLGAARRRLEQHDDELQKHERRLMRLFARHLRLSFDYFEHQTGQVIGAMYAGHLPVSHAWIGRALAQAVEVKIIEPDLGTWSESAGIQLASRDLSATWLGSLSLLADLTTVRPSADATAA